MYFIVLLVVSTCTYHAYVSMDRSPTGGICRPWNQWLPWNPAQEIFVNCYRIWRPWSNNTRCKCKFMLKYVCSYSCGVDFSNVYMFYGCLFHPQYRHRICLQCVFHMYITYTVCTYIYIYTLYICLYTWCMLADIHAQRYRLRNPVWRQDDHSCMKSWTTFQIDIKNPGAPKKEQFPDLVQGRKLPDIPSFCLTAANNNWFL